MRTGFGLSALPLHPDGLVGTDEVVPPHDQPFAGVETLKNLNTTAAQEPEYQQLVAEMTEDQPQEEDK